VEGRAFVRTCPQNTRWIQPLLSCISEEIISATTAETTPAPSLLRDLVRPLTTGGQQQYGQLPQPQQFSDDRQLDLPVVQQPQGGYTSSNLPVPVPQGRLVEPPVNTLPAQQIPFGQTRVSSNQQVAQPQTRLNNVAQQQQQLPVGRNFQDFEQQQQVPVARVPVSQQQQQSFGRSSSQLIQVPQLQTPIDLQVPVHQQQQQQLRGRTVQVQPQQQFRQQF
jgi:hypothetical protein